jgi:hypothetical protein
MVNYLTNDRGETVIAVGAPGSVERARVEWPAIIEYLDNGCFDPGVSYEDLKIIIMFSTVSERHPSAVTEIEVETIILASRHRKLAEGKRWMNARPCDDCNETSFYFCENQCKKYVKWIIEKPLF